MKNFLKYIFIILISFALLIFYYSVKNSQNTVEKINNTNEEESNSYFTIEKIVAYSSANAEENELNTRADWEVSVYQFTDLAIYIKFIKNMDIKAISIENIGFETKPQLGNPIFYIRKLKNYGNKELKLILENKIEQDKIDFEVIETNEPIDDNKLQFKKDASIPLTFGYLNEEILKNYIIRDIDVPLSYDSSILKRTKIAINDIKCSIKFTIKVTNIENKSFSTNLVVELPITENLYDGDQTVTIDN